jgi:hypothetical protein
MKVSAKSLKQFSIELGGSILRLTLLIWLFVVIGLFFDLGIALPLDMRLDTISLLDLIWVFLVFSILQLSKLDVKLIVNHVGTWQFKLLVYLFYVSIWGMVLFRYYSGDNYRMLARSIWMISPLAEFFLSYFIYFPISWINQDLLHSIFEYSVDVGMSFFASFVVLGMFLKFAKDIVHTRHIQTKNVELREFFILWSAFALRLVLIVWVFGIIARSCNISIGMAFYPILLFLFLVLYFSKLDVKFILNNIDKWQLKVIVYVFYAWTWGMILYRYYVDEGHEKGLALMFNKLIISPLSEIFLSLFVYLPISWINRDAFVFITSNSHVNFVVSIFASFVSLEMLLRLSKRIWSRSGRPIEKTMKACKT